MTTETEPTAAPAAFESTAPARFAGSFYPFAVMAAGEPNAIARASSKAWAERIAASLTLTQEN